MTIATGTLVAAAVAAFLLAATLPLVAWAGRRDGPVVARTMRWGLVVKLAAAPVQLWVTTRFYGGVADFNLYHGMGRRVAADFPASLFADDGGRLVGIRFIGMVAGTIYTFIGVNKLGAFLVFSWFGFLGQFFFFRAFRTALPDADAVRYARLLFFLPSVVFWPSVLGKDAWMCMALGLAALGCARLLTRRRGGFVVCAAGLAAGSLVRPHVVLLLFLAAAVAYLVRRAERPGSLDFAAKLAGAAVLVVGGLALLGSVERFFSVDGSGPGAVTEVLDTTSRTTQGQIGNRDEKLEEGFGSSFDPAPLRSPLRFPQAAATVLFRPWPFEARNLPSLVSSAEGVVLLGLFVLSRRRVLGGARLLRSRPYVTLAVLYSALFVYFFAAIGNFGILARQKAQVLPLLLVLLALPRPEPAGPPAGRPQREQALTPSTTRARS